MHQRREVAEIDGVRRLVSSAETVLRELCSVDFRERHVIGHDDHSRIETQYRLPAQRTDGWPRNTKLDHPVRNRTLLNCVPR